MQSLCANGQYAYHGGLAAEEAIARDYESRNMPIAHRRWRGQAGEIDIIARDGDTVVFIEVKKARSVNAAAWRLRPAQVARICAAAEEFVANEPRGTLTDIRIDLGLVGADGQFQVIENALA